ncbi:hypothetical protein [Streptomyces sp. NPDC048603]|uniref:FitA-like ribbon-helix-helix domain-containing protein n=1 Tax=Streptomyces sp. NPDC048603 TaxID=3365577 RepID=UPI0037142AE6
MATLHVHGLSVDVLAALKARAARNRQSLQTYVRTLLEQEADPGEIDLSTIARSDADRSG